VSRVTRNAASGLRLALAAFAVLPMLAPLLGTDLHVALQPYTPAAAAHPLEQPLSVRSVSGVFALLAVAGWLALASRSRNVSWWEAGLVLLGGALALVRLGNVWVLALALVLAIGRQLTLARLRTRDLAAGIGVLVCATLAVGVYGRPEPVPASALRALSDAPAANAVLSFQPWARELARTANGRAVLGARDAWDLDPSFWLDYERASGGHRTWPAILERYDVGTLVLESRTTQAELATLVRESPEWRVLFDSGDALVATRARR
jgi:hypothetical protein